MYKSPFLFFHRQKISNSCINPSCFSSTIKKISNSCINPLSFSPPSSTTYEARVPYTSRHTLKVLAGAPFHPLMNGRKVGAFLRLSPPFSLTQVKRYSESDAGYRFYPDNFLFSFLALICAPSESVAFFYFFFSSLVASSDSVFIE